MKKLFCLIILLTSANFAFAGVVNPSGDSLNDDLSFSLEDQAPESDREVASEETSDSEKSEDSDSERDIASDVVESTDSKMLYWKY